ncbi:hypothetical protein GCM10007148_28460 [Parvularcula lutaonensis]|nr:hypothetical protein GCM10007148_28460 [Parvularcula lutaonensis]
MTVGMNSDAWNNFVTNSIQYETFEPNDPKRVAAVAALAWGMVQNGGYNAFLTSSYDLEADEVLKALRLASGHHRLPRSERV